MSGRSCCAILAASLMAATIPGFAAQMQNNAGMSSQQDQSSQAPVRGHREAMKMVPVRATFTKTLESKDAQPGTPIDVKLTRDATLDNGTKLDKGTMLDGRVVTDNSQNESPRLAVRFTQARLENGQTIPIKATIVGIYNTPDVNGDAAYWGGDPNSIPTSWNDGTLQVDQIDALPGIDLHSKISSQNSGVFVSNKKNDIKLTSEYSLTLAVAPRNQGGMNGMNDGMGNGSSNGMNNGMNNNSGMGRSANGGMNGNAGSGMNGGANGMQNAH